MMPPSEWLKPPRSLLLILFLVTLVSVSALAWFGWRVLYQEQAVDTQRAQERLEQAADRIAATARGALAETGEQVGAWLSLPPSAGKPEEGLLLILGKNSLAALPANRLLYRPFASAEADAPVTAFSDGELLEFQQADPGKAIEWYRRRLAGSKDSAVRAGALLRLARVLRNSGHVEEARATYAELGGISGAWVAGVPAELVAIHELCVLSGKKDDALAFQADLLRGRWPLTRGQYQFYWSEAGRLAGSEAPVPAEAAAWAEVVVRAWEELQTEQGQRGQETLWVDGQPYFLIWRGIPGRRAVLMTRPEWLLKPAFTGGGVSGAALDVDGRVVAGHKYQTGHAVVRTTAETMLPWTLYFTAAQGAADAGMAARQRFLVLVTVVTALFLIAGAYFIARAVRRDLEVSRMQSDFVAAVSHEFRSPLTSIRQLSELLAEGRVPGQERRQVYYDTLVRETTRLQRLVEALLNFGRMEAGVRQYRFEEMDASNLVERVAAEFEPQIANSGRHIELEAAPDLCPIDADPEALSVALRNLVDNALKYSPGCPTVWVQWRTENAHVAIRVRDSGLGIPASERRAIFRKFFRGTAAATANVKGSGVGLAMVRHIVAAHGGEISVVSEPGEGSTFTMLLPAGEEK
jgi:signal transduction histidine kinase/predicted negative regulator of RcsB-dependent stress response